MAEGAGFELTVRFLATLKLKALVRVDRSVASAANGNQVFLAIGSAMAAKAKVVYFDCRYGSTDLAAPAVPLENAPMQFLILYRARPLLTLAVVSRHAATPSVQRNCCWWDSGNRRKSRRADSNKVAGVTSSPAPARKSAQIISRQ
jgi:hypothetical protein